MDHSATTHVREEVFEAMKPYFTKSFGNPSTIYSLGREAKVAMEQAREKVANIIGANPDEIIFTSGGTESDNIAIQGIAYKLKEAGKGNHIITSAIEHPAVIETCEALEEKGFEVTYLQVYENGIVKVEDLKAAIKDETILITIMHANNEIGTLQPIAEIGKIATEYGIKFHTDAVQTVGKIPVNVNDLNVDLLSISSHKIYGPKGVGALYIKKGTRLQPIIHGGGQEKDLVSGTENIPGIVGLGEACKLAGEELDKNIENIKKLRNKLIDGVLSKVEQSYLNGDKYNRLPGLVNFRFSGIEGESIVLMLDAKGIAGATGSACSSHKLTASHVLKAIKLEDFESHGSLRLSIGYENTEEEVDTVIKEIPPIIATLRNMSPIWNKDDSHWRENTKNCDI